MEKSVVLSMGAHPAPLGLFRNARPLLDEREIRRSKRKEKKKNNFFETSKGPGSSRMSFLLNVNMSPVTQRAPLRLFRNARALLDEFEIRRSKRKEKKKKEKKKKYLFRKLYEWRRFESNELSYFALLERQSRCAPRASEPCFL